MNRKFLAACRIRNIDQRDLGEVLAIEGRCFEYPWHESNFKKLLKPVRPVSSEFCKVVTYTPTDVIVGFVVYKFHRRRMEVLNFAVHEDWRYLGVGRLMFQFLVRKLSPRKRNRIVLHVRETNLAAQLFFQRCGMWATRIIPEYYENDEDAYEFEHQLFVDVHAGAIVSEGELA